MPEMIANTMIGSMLLRLIRPEKSFTVREFTIISPTLAASAISAFANWMEVLAAGGQMLTTVSTNAAANRPVTIKVSTRLPRILPRRFMLTMFPTAVVMDTNTIGTTMVNIRFRKISPSGFNTVAFSPRVTPKSAPTTMPITRIIGNR